MYPEMLLAGMEATIDGRPFTALTQADLVGLLKLDSFIKESQRISPFSSLSMVRPINSTGGATLSGGMHLPLGIFIGTPVRACCATQTSFRTDSIACATSSYVRAAGTRTGISLCCWGSTTRNLARASRLAFTDGWWVMRQSL